MWYLLSLRSRSCGFQVRVEENLGTSRTREDRGPDEHGFVGDDSSIFVHHRLSMVDGPSGKQPMESKSKDRVLSVNGEIYNHDVLYASRNFRIIE